MCNTTETDQIKMQIDVTREALSSVALTRLTQFEGRLLLGFKNNTF